ncbi:MAG: hypothetical protein WB761_10785, partial [Solirubrobacteraceae bacterium]
LLHGGPPVPDGLGLATTNAPNRSGRAGRTASNFYELPDNLVLVVCLAASTDIAAERVAAREPDSWPGKAALVDHARTLAQQIPAIPGLDLVISTVDRAAADVAARSGRLFGITESWLRTREVPVPRRSRTKSVKPTSVDQAGSG